MLHTVKVRRLGNRKRSQYGIGPTTVQVNLRLLLTTNVLVYSTIARSCSVSD